MSKNKIVTAVCAVLGLLGLGCGLYDFQNGVWVLDIEINHAVIKDHSAWLKRKPNTEHYTRKGEIHGKEHSDLP